MERKGAAYHITSSRPGGADPAPRTTLYPWKNDEAHDTETGLMMSISRHPSGGHTAETARDDGSRVEIYGAGPFRTPQRAQVAAEALGQRSLGLGDISKYRKRSY